MKTSLESFINRTAKEMRSRGKFSAAKTCISVFRGISGIIKSEEIYFSDLTPGSLAEYEHHLITRERNRNTVSLYMRTLQNICNRAAREGAADIPEDLFEGVSFATVPVRHRAVTSEVIQKIRDAVFEGKDARLAFARDMFMLSFYLRGIPFIDLAHLRKCDLKNGMITYCRRKTKKPACVKVEACAIGIIKRYAPLTKGMPYLLPIIKRQGTAEEEQRQYESALRLYNKRLNKISEKLGLGIPLTSYVARHSWATIAHDIGVDVADISEALCHTSEKMTRNYLKSFSPDRLAGVNRKVLQAINKKESVGHIKRIRGKCKISKEKFSSGSL